MIICGFVIHFLELALLGISPPHVVLCELQLHGYSFYLPSTGIHRDYIRGKFSEFFFFTQWAITITGHNRTWCEELKCRRERLELSREFNKDIYSWAVICKCVILAFASLLKR